MPVQLTDAEIEQLLNDPKPLPADYQKRIQTKTKGAHKEAELEITSTQGNEFRLVLRQSTLNSLDFSIILIYCFPNSNQLFRLRRYNGKSHEHTNKLEGDRFYDFHIHYATERYQASGLREDAFAQVTSRYADPQTALGCAIQDCGFVTPANPQPSLFDEEE
ncbi:MAG: DUF6978 family protein [Blastocatellia bacterium]